VTLSFRPINRKMSHEIRVLDLFSGIGGFALGLRAAGGFKTVAYCEIEPFCQEVLQARMRDGSLDTAPICTDIRKLDGKPLRGRVEMVCGGFPCQDISEAGLRAGIDGERSGLWREMARLVCEIRPRFVFVENVSDLLVRGMHRVLGDLASLGFHAEWRVLPACGVGAPHCRERVWIVAYPSEQSGIHESWYGNLLSLSDGGSLRSPWHSPRWPAAPHPELCRVDDGIPRRVDRHESLGNAVVPLVIRWIGQRIMKATSAVTRKGVIDDDD